MRRAPSGRREERRAWGTSRDRGEGGEGRPGVSPAPQLSLISQNLLLLRKVPAPTAASLQCRERSDEGPGWLSPLLSPLAPCALAGKDQGLPSLGLELWRSPTGRGGPWMSPRNFPEKARKSCLVSNHFPSHRPPFVPVQISCLLLLLLPLSFPRRPSGRKGHDYTCSRSQEGNEVLARRL